MALPTLTYAKYGFAGHDFAAFQTVTIDAASEDAGNDPVTTLRDGLLMGIVRSTGKVKPWRPIPNDGSEVAHGFLSSEVVMGGVDRKHALAVAGSIDESLVHASWDVFTPRVWDQLSHRFTLLGFPHRRKTNLGPRFVRRVNTDTTLSIQDSGGMFVATSIAEFTLPPWEYGLCYRFLMVNNTTLTITKSTGDTPQLWCPGFAPVDQIIFATTGELVGAHMLLEAMLMPDDTPFWSVVNLGGVFPSTPT